MGGNRGVRMNAAGAGRPYGGIPNTRTHFGAGGGTHRRVHNVAGHNFFNGDWGFPRSSRPIQNGCLGFLGGVTSVVSISFLALAIMAGAGGLFLGSLVALGVGVVMLCAST